MNLALLCCLSFVIAVGFSSAQQVISPVLYTAISNASLCINPYFTITYQQVSEATCALLCIMIDRCQAFTTAEGPCRLFVFDKCSKYVRNCTCTRRGVVYIKQQSGLAPGSLCPAGYGDDLCGVKYKMYSNIGVWSQGRQKCESEKGLVIMSDVVDRTEMDYINVTFSGIFFWLGGYQMPGSVEPAGGWYWVGCNFTVDSSLWRSGEPNNLESNETVVQKDATLPDLNDSNENDTRTTAVLCECISPFN